jgi:hypothetical protein
MFLFKKRLLSKLQIHHTVALFFAFGYWLYHFEAFQTEYLPFQFGLGLFGITFIAVLYLFFSRAALTQKQRVFLSSLTALLTLLFVGHYAFELFEDYRWEMWHKSKAKWEYFVAFFFLGVGLIYVVQNIYLLYDFFSPTTPDFPSKLKETVEQHLMRYEAEKPQIYQGILIVLLITMFIVVQIISAFFNPLIFVNLLVGIVGGLGYLLIKFDLFMSVKKP